MAYSAEVMKRARARLAQEKADRESENRQHLQQAYAQVPRLLEIDKQLRQNMALAVQAVFMKDGAQDLLEQAKEKNFALQQERDALAAQYFEEGYLDESPICSICGGTGYIGSSMCQCLEELCRQEQKKQISVLHVGKESFEDFRLEYYSQQVNQEWGVSARAIMEKTFRICQNFAVNFSVDSPNLLFSGSTGLGKTFLSACIAKVVAGSGYSVVYETAAHLFSNMERAKFEADEDAKQEVRKYTAADLLIVDDLGTEMGGQFTTSALYTLVNDRLLSGSSTIISTNLTTEELERRYSPQIASRLRGEYLRVPFVGEDIRILKSRRL